MSDERVLLVDSKEPVPKGMMMSFQPEPIRSPVSKTGIPGFPETQRHTVSSVKKDFQIEWIDVDPECRGHFVVNQCFVGQYMSWNAAENSVTPHMLAQKPAIDFPKCPVGLLITLQVTNISDQERVFRARLVGRDVETKNPSIGDGQT